VRSFLILADHVFLGRPTSGPLAVTRPLLKSISVRRAFSHSRYLMRLARLVSSQHMAYAIGRVSALKWLVVDKSHRQSIPGTV
jgi:hypothetical protein